MDERDWTDNSWSMEQPLRLGEALVEIGHPPSSVSLIGGSLSSGLSALSPAASLLGLLDDAKGANAFAIRMSRSTALLVQTAGARPDAGWYEAGYGISDVTDAYVRFCLSGPSVPWILAQCGVADVNATSPSASLLVSGVTSLLIRNQAHFEIWVPRAYSAYMATVFAGVHTEPLPTP